MRLQRPLFNLDNVESVILPPPMALPLIMALLLIGVSNAGLALDTSISTEFCLFVCIPLSVLLDSSLNFPFPNPFL